MENKPTLIIMVGVPGCGKDFHILNNKFFKQYEAMVVSRDVIRFSMLKEGDDYFKNESKVFSAFVKDIAMGLDEGYNVIANATHINRSSRRKLIQSVDQRVKNKDYKIVFFVVDSELEVIRAQNDSRVGLKKVPDSVVEDMYNKLSIPSYSEDLRIDDIWIMRNKIVRKESR